MRFTINGDKWVELSRRFFFAVTLMWSCLVQAQLQVPEQWQSTLQADHELVGTIWSQAEQAFIAPAELATRLQQARYLLLGEKHDNPDHHALQLSVLDYLLARNKVSNVTFEMMDETVAERLLDIQLQPGLAGDEMKAYLLWDEEGWDWQFYGPLVQAVYDAGIRLAAGNINRDTIGQVYADPDFIDTSGILDESAMTQLNLEIDESHCGMLPESQFPAMVRVQQARDRAMARAMQRPPEGMVSVLVAGNFHVRQDLGVPNYLAAREPTMAREQIVSLAFLEVQDGETDANVYQEQFTDRAAFDYIWFTPALTNEDYCASLQQ